MWIEAGKGILTEKGREPFPSLPFTTSLRRTREGALPALLGVAEQVGRSIVVIESHHRPCLGQSRG